MQEYQNKLYDSCVPKVSIVTPIYNRTGTIMRTLNSLSSQTFQNFEAILVDDGSTDRIDGCVLPFMEEASFPILYIKKQNGGVHTARNAAIRRARGFFTVFLDSDDELVPNALARLLEIWDSIPLDRQKEYREVCVQCCDAEGNRIGDPFPNHINEEKWKKAQILCDKTHGEHFAMNVTEILKNNAWPEPSGITFVTEDVVWRKLDMEYKSYFANDLLRIYHTDTDNSLVKGKKRNVQFCKNMQWNLTYQINHRAIYKNAKNGLLKTLILQMIYTDILNLKKEKPEKAKKYHLLRVLLWIPVRIMTIVYVKKKNIQ